MSHMLEVGDGDPWGREGPPEEAYSRVTRDLATITPRWHLLPMRPTPSTTGSESSAIPSPD